MRVLDSSVGVFTEWLNQHDINRHLKNGEKFTDMADVGWYYN